MQLQIGIYVFTVSEPYSSGCIMNAAEAEILNRIRAENLAQQLMPKMKELWREAEAKGHLVMTDEEIGAAQSLVRQKDREYQLKPAPARPKYGTIDYRARQLALQDAQAEALARGHLMTDEESQREVEKRLESEELWTRAKAIFIAEARAAREGIRSLIG